MHAGKKLKILVEENNVNQSEFAEKIGRKREYLYELYKKEHINTELLTKIAKYFGVRMSYFFDEDNNHVNESSEQYGLSIHEKYIKSLEREISRLNSELEEYKKNN